MIHLIEERIQRFRPFRPQSKIEELHALKEAIQELVLFSLSQSNFFELSSFLGGTALRILYKLPRFSEDLDFSSNDKNFSWEELLRIIESNLSVFGFKVDCVDKSSFVKILNCQHPRNKPDISSIKICLEIDVNPPLGERSEIKYCDFPTPFGVKVYTAETLFASKINAILTRNFAKGRDWFDLLWYLDKIEINFEFLAQSLKQFEIQAPDNVDNNWVADKLLGKIKSLDIKLLKDDIQALLPKIFRNTLTLWNMSFFERKITDWATN